MSLDILAIGVHPDDVELGCSGTILKQRALGNSVGILDLTLGELGTRGDAETRRRESLEAAKILGVDIRENIGLEDGFFRNDKASRLELIKVIRRYCPEVVFANAHYDRHPDHGRAAELIRDACFLAGLTKVETKWEGRTQTAFRPRAVYHYIQALSAEPDFVVDITPFFDTKMKSILAYRSQFFNSESKEPSTFISSPEFLEFTKARALHYGIPAGVTYAEAFTVNRTPCVRSVMELY